LGSTNGVAVNDSPVTESDLADGDELRLGGSVFRFLQGEDLDKRYQRLLAEGLSTDGLTGLMSEEGFHFRLLAEERRSRRYGRPLSVILFEIEEFTVHSRQLGQIGADLSLRRVARILGETLRDSDSLAHLANARFVALLPETSAEAAADCLERLRDLARPTLHQQRLVAVTVGLEDVASGEDLLQRAQSDLALLRKDAAPGASES